MQSSNILKSSKQETFESFSNLKSSKCKARETFEMPGKCSKLRESFEGSGKVSKHTFESLDLGKFQNILSKVWINPNFRNILLYIIYNFLKLNGKYYLYIVYILSWETLFIYCYIDFLLFIIFFNIYIFICCSA